MKLSNCLTVGVLSLAFLCSVCIHPVNSEKILFFFGVSTYSHRLIAWPFVEALAERNHSVTFFQPDQNKNPHPKVIEINPKLDGLSDQVNFLLERLKHGYRLLLLKLTYKLPSIGLNLCDAYLSDPVVIKWINDSKFDLIIIDTLFNECAYGIAHKMGAKTAIFSTTHPLGFLPDAMGFPAETWWIPEVHFSFDLPLSFINRVYATLSVLYFNAIRYMTFPKLEAVLREKLQMPDMPSIPDMMANTSLLLSNTHFSEELPRSMPPNVISIGGMNCKEKSSMKEIPNGLKEFLNGSGDAGFILISFGSGAKISTAPLELQEIFFKAIEKVPEVRFLWKWEGERPKRMPSNLMTLNWIPQQEILAHPKIRAFITHGGLLSMHESICHPVPMICIPVFAEQDYNAERLHRTGRGIRLEISTLKQNQLDDAIDQILHNKSYKENVVKVSKRFMDRPRKPVDDAVWWTEYVLRQDDTSFMRPLAVNQTWYQKRLLDVWGFMLMIILIFTYVSTKVTQCVIKYLWRKITNDSTASKLKVT